jgi:hypothetical protein
MSPATETRLTSDPVVDTFARLSTRLSADPSAIHSQMESSIKWNHNQLLLTWEHDYKGSSMLNSYHMITGGGVDQLGGQGL